MIRKPAIWLLCFALVLSRLLGLHAHSCVDLDTAGQAHEAVHYADAGFLFGEVHSSDHQDNLELELSAMPATLKVGLEGEAGHLALPAGVSPKLELAHSESGLLPLEGPPSYFSRRAHFAPPLRGPPSNSFA